MHTCIYGFILEFRNYSKGKAGWLTWQVDRFAVLLIQTRVHKGVRTAHVLNVSGFSFFSSYFIVTISSVL